MGLGYSRAAEWACDLYLTQRRAFEDSLKATQQARGGQDRSRPKRISVTSASSGTSPARARRARRQGVRSNGARSRSRSRSRSGSTLFHTGNGADHTAAVAVTRARRGTGAASPITTAASPAEEALVSPTGHGYEARGSGSSSRHSTQASPVSPASPQARRRSSWLTSTSPPERGSLCGAGEALPISEQSHVPMNPHLAASGHGITLSPATTSSFSPTPLSPRGCQQGSPIGVTTTVATFTSSSPTAHAIPTPSPPTARRSYSRRASQPTPLSLIPEHL